MTLTQPAEVDKYPNLIPTQMLSAAQFEDFTERLLSAHRFCVGEVRKVQRVTRWGNPGDMQDGIDLEGEWSDGSSAAWQCKRVDALPPADVRAAVQACTFSADRYYLVYSSRASTRARHEIKSHPGWEIVDRLNLHQLLDDLPLHKKREVLDQTWGRQWRRQLMPWAGGDDAFDSLETFRRTRLDHARVLNDCGALVGREHELGLLGGALADAAQGSSIVVVSGAGGRGKSRLLVEAMTDFSLRHLDVPVIVRAPGRRFDADAALELPLTPAVIAVDDVHRDMADLRALLEHPLRVPGTRLILASRTHAVSSLRAELATAGHRLSDVCFIEVGELSRSEARTMVKSLCGDLGIRYTVLDYLARQAERAPYVAVIAANLIRHGKLEAPLTWHDGIRQEVVARFHDTLTSDIDGFDAGTVGKAFASYVALGPVDDSDVDLRVRIAKFCALRDDALLRLIDAAEQRGVLHTRDGLTGVVPDVLADEILERQAVVGSKDTKFVEAMWQQFGMTHTLRLATVFGELDWRLARQNRPSVAGPVWRGLASHLADLDQDGLYEVLPKLQRLAASQPKRVYELLEALRARLVAGDPDENAGRSTDAQLHPRAHGANIARLRHGLAPVGQQDNLMKLPEIYVQCAAAGPDLLEDVLDALESIEHLTTPVLQSKGGTIAQLIDDRLADLGHLPDETFPLRIVDWHMRREDGQDAARPLAFGLAALLAKDGSRTEMQSARRIGFLPYFIHASRVRHVRDRIRDLLRRTALDGDPMRVSASLGLLETALRRPRGEFQREVTSDEILSWEDDDLATIVVLRDVADRTSSATVRRRIAHTVGWHADYAASLRVRHAALVLATELDNRSEDNLAEYLLHGVGLGEKSRRGVAVPSVGELKSEIERDAQGERADDEEVSGGVDLTAAAERVDARQRAQAGLLERVVSSLVGMSGPVEIIDVLSDALDEVQAIGPQGTQGGGAIAWLLYRLVHDYPALAGDLVDALAPRAAGAIDAYSDALLTAWAGHDLDGVERWLRGFAGQRDGIRLGVAGLFVRADLAERGDASRRVLVQGLRDEHAEVRRQFVLACHPLVRSAPAVTSATLLPAQLDSATAAQLLEYASRFDGKGWSVAFDAAGADAVLSLIDAAGLDSYTTVEILAGVSTVHPRLALEHMTSHPLSQPMVTDELALAFDTQAQIFAEWVVEQSRADDLGPGLQVIGLVIPHVLSARQADVLASFATALTDAELGGILDLLTEAGPWPLYRPALARAFLARARELGAATLGRSEHRISSSMQVQSYGFVNGVSTELNNARSIVAMRASDEPDAVLRRAYERAAANLDSVAAALHASEPADDDTWDIDAP